MTNDAKSDASSAAAHPIAPGGGPAPVVDLTVPRVPAPKGGLRHHIAGIALWIGGWKPIGDPPALDKYIIVAAPHTAWWDGFWMKAFAWWWGVRIQWLVKSGAAWGPFGVFLRSVGAIPVDRSGPQGLVGAMVRKFAEHPRLVVSIPAEGTRARRRYWKSGFYQMALQAKVPICLSLLDYGSGRGGFGPCFHPTGDVTADMDRIREFYRDARGKVPDRFTPPRLREEDGAAALPELTASSLEDAR